MFPNKAQLIFGGIALLVILSGGFYIHHQIYKDGYKACEDDYAAAVVVVNEKVKTKKKVVKHETQNLDRAGIVKQLCDAGWVRDNTGCPN